MSERGRGITITVAALSVMGVAHKIADGENVIGICGNQDESTTFYFGEKQLDPLIRALERARVHLNDAVELPLNVLCMPEEEEDDND